MRARVVGGHSTARDSRDSMVGDRATLACSRRLTAGWHACYGRMGLSTSPVAIVLAALVRMRPLRGISICPFVFPSICVPLKSTMPLEHTMGWTSG